MSAAAIILMMENARRRGASRDAYIDEFARTATPEEFESYSNLVRNRTRAAFRRLTRKWKLEKKKDIFYMVWKFFKKLKFKIKYKMGL